MTIDIQFNKATGFRFYNGDFGIEHTDSDPQRGEDTFQSLLYDRIVSIVNSDAKEGKEENLRAVVDVFLANPDSLKEK
jgi:hypothetical protein